MKRKKVVKSDEIEKIFTGLVYLTGRRLSLYTTIECYFVIMFNGMRLITIHDIKHSSSAQEICSMADAIVKIIDEFDLK